MALLRKIPTQALNDPIPPFEDGPMLHALFKKEIHFKYRKTNLAFQSAQDLFSSHTVDVGSRLLLRAMDDCGFDSNLGILDLGCGYGPIGLSLMKAGVVQSAHLVDRDALALGYAKRNAELNSLQSAYIYGSLDCSYVEPTLFDVVASNIPAKAGEPVQWLMLQRARAFVSPGGVVAIVVVRALEHVIRRFIETNSDVEVLSEVAAHRHLVAILRFPRQDVQLNEALVGGVPKTYLRGRMSLQFRGHSFLVETAYGIPEFDNLGYHTQLLLRALSSVEWKEIKSALVYNVGQGHIALIAAQSRQLRQLTLVDRDLLGLQVAEHNIALSLANLSAKVSFLHSVGLPNHPKTYDFIVGNLVHYETHESLRITLERTSRLVTTGGRILLTGDSAVISRGIRILKSLTGMRVRRRMKTRGFSLIELEAV